MEIVQALLNILFLGGMLMNDKVNFNVIEKNKTNNTKDIQKAINIIMNKLISRQFVNLQH